MGDSARSIMISMIPIGILFVLVIVYAIYRRSKNTKANKSTAEANAIIEAQAMLVKMQKEQAEKTKNKDTEDKSEDKKPMSQNTDSQDKPEKTEKPKAEAPISDTTDLEPDIDKTEAE